jgi:hypothetical protein
LSSIAAQVVSLVHGVVHTPHTQLSSPGQPWSPHAVKKWVSPPWASSVWLVEQPMAVAMIAAHAIQASA